MGQSVTVAKIVVNVEDGLERMGLSFENVLVAPPPKKKKKKKSLL